MAIVGFLMFCCGSPVRACWAKLKCDRILAVEGRGFELSLLKPQKNGIFSILSLTAMVCTDIVLPGSIKDKDCKNYPPFGIAKSKVLMNHLGQRLIPRNQNSGFSKKARQGFEYWYKEPKANISGKGGQLWWSLGKLIYPSVLYIVELNLIAYSDNHSDQLIIAIIRLLYRSYAHYTLYRSCLPICRIVIVRSLSFWFLDEFEKRRYQIWFYIR